MLTIAEYLDIAMDARGTPAIAPICEEIEECTGAFPMFGSVRSLDPFNPDLSYTERRRKVEPVAGVTWPDLSPAWPLRYMLEYVIDQTGGSIDVTRGVIDDMIATL